MKTNRLLIAASCTFALLLVGCGGASVSTTQSTTSGGGGPNDPIAGNADFSRLVTIGDSLTAGFADGALYLHGQQNSYPAILAGQLATVGSGALSQPLVSDNVGGLLFNGNPLPGFGKRLVLNNTSGSLAPEPVNGTTITDIAVPASGSPFNNMGIPGAKSYHLIADGYGNPLGVQASAANPYFVRFASAPGTNVIADAMRVNPSFFVLWIGNNDTLSYATGGGTGVDQLGNPNPASYGSADITDPTAFAGIYQGIVNTLISGGAKGVLISLPDVTSIPFFTTVPYNAIPMDQATADATNSAAAILAYNGGLMQAAANSLITADEAARRTISFAAGQNAVVIIDENLTDLSALSLPSIRQAIAADFILLTASSKIGTLANPNDPTSVIGVGVPLGDGDVLTEAEAALVAAANGAFNATIKSIADGNDNIALYDAAASLATLKTSGINYGTGVITSTFATGGAFSLDGVHPTARGYAVIANQIIDLIESSFGATIPPVNPGDFTTTLFQ